MTQHDLDVPFDPTALLVIRVWIEPQSQLRLRAHIRETNDVSLGFQNSMTVADVDSATAIVRAWLERAIAAAPHDGQNGTPATDR